MTSSNAQFLVTGGAGFIGSHLVEALVAGNRDSGVRVLDNLATGFRENLASIRDQVDFIEGDLRDPDAVKLAVKGVQVVFHEAALPSVSRSLADPLESNSANVSGTLNLLLAARDAGVRRVIIASSSSVYGNVEEPSPAQVGSTDRFVGPLPMQPKVEAMTPSPLSPYAVTKLAGEMYARVFSQLYGLETISLRYFNVFGPRQDPTTQYAGAIAKFITCAIRGDPYPVFGDGEQSRDFTYVENVVKANLLASNARIKGYAMMNVACGQCASLNQVISVLNGLTGQALPTMYLAPRPGDVRHSLASIARAHEILGYAPTVDLKEGLKRTLDWYRGSTERRGASS